MADRYWVGGTGTWNTTNTANWSTQSGGSGGASVPTTADSVFFDQAGTYTVTCTGALACLDFTVSAGVVTFAQGTSSAFTIAGSLSLIAGTVWSASGALDFISASTGKTITTNGTTFPSAIAFTGNGSWTLGSSLTVTGVGQINIAAGTVDTAGYAMTCGLLNLSSGTGSRAIILNNSTVTLTASGTNPLNAPDTVNLTFNAGTSQINFSAAGAGINSGGLTFYNVAFTSTTAGTNSITGANTFNNLSVTAPSTAGTTLLTFNSRQTINGTLSTTNTAGNCRVWFRSSTYGIAQTLAINSTPSLTDADFRDIYVIGTAAPISGTRIGDLRGCTGITFSTPKTVYWRGSLGTGTWTNNSWSSTAVGSPSTDNYPLAQDTAIIDNSSITTNLSFGALNNLPSIDFSQRTSDITVAIGSANVIYGNWTSGSGITISNTADFTFSGRNTQTITSAGKTFSCPIIVDSYGGTVELADALILPSTRALTVTNGTFDTKNYSITVGSLSSSNSNVRTIKLGSSTVSGIVGFGSINFSTSTNLTFDAGTSTINCTDGGNVSLTGGQSAGFPTSFYNVNFSPPSVSPTLNLTIEGVNTFNNLAINNQADASRIYNVIIKNNQTINGTFTCSGFTATRRTFVYSDTLGTTRTLTVGTLVATDCDFRDITIAGAAAGSSPTRAGDCGGNSGITFPAAKTVYWNLTGNQNWSATAWCNSSGGTPDINNFPLAQDTAVINTSGTPSTITIDAAWHTGTVDTSSLTNPLIGVLTLNNSLFIHGDWIAGPATLFVNTTTPLVFSKRGTQTITCGGSTFNCAIIIDSVTGTVQLADALSVLSIRTLTLTSGTFDAVTYNVTTGRFISSGSITRTLKMGSGTWTLSGTGTVWDLGGATTNLNFYKSTANITLSNNGVEARSFNGGSQSYNKLTIGGATGTSTLTLFGINQFTELASTKTVAHTISFSNAQTFGKWTVTGTVGNVVTLAGTVASNVLAGSCTSGIDYLAMGFVGFATTSTGEFYAGVNSTAISAVAPTYLTAKPADSTRYWVGGTGDWGDTARWSTESGGSGGASVPRSHDDVVFDSGSNATAYTATVTGGFGGFRMKSLTIAGPASGNVTLAGSTAIDGIHGNVTLPATGLTRTYTGSITLSGSTTGRTFTTNGVALASAITINGVNCGWSLGSALNMGSNTLTITNGTFDLATYNLTAGSIVSNNNNPRTINFNTGITTLSGGIPVNFGATETNRANLTVTAGTSQINLTTATPTFSGNNQTFYNVSFTNVSTSTININGTNSFNNLSFTGRTSAGLKTIFLAANQTITGTLTLSGGTNATMRHFVTSDTVGTIRTLTVNAFSGTDADFRDIAITGAAAPVSGTRLGDCKGNSGITFTAGTNKYWNLAAGGNWSATGWSTGSGGSPAPDINNFPLAQDTCWFESTGLNNNATVTINASYNIGTINMSGRTTNTMTLATGSTTPTIYGNWINGTGTTASGSAILKFAGRTNQTIISAGKIFTQAIEIFSPNGSVILEDSFQTTYNGSNGFQLFIGNFDANGYNVTLPNAQFTSSAATTRTIAVGSGTWTIGATSGWLVTGPNLTITGTGTIRLTSASAKSFSGGGLSYTNITIDQAGSGALTIAGNNTFKNITNSYKTTGATTISLGSTTQTVSQFTASGEANRLLTLTGSPANIVLTNPATSDYLNLSGIRAYPITVKNYAGQNSVNSGSLGWVFENSPVVNSDFLSILIF